MFSLDQFNELGILRIVDVGAEGYVIDCEPTWNRTPRQRGDFLGLRLDILQ